jgi:hypothetical protein
MIVGLQKTGVNEKGGLGQLSKKAHPAESRRPRPEDWADLVGDRDDPGHHLFCACVPLVAGKVSTETNGTETATRKGRLRRQRKVRTSLKDKAIFFGAYLAKRPLTPL